MPLILQYDSRIKTKQSRRPWPRQLFYWTVRSDPRTTEIVANSRSFAKISSSRFTHQPLAEEHSRSISISLAPAVCGGSRRHTRARPVLRRAQVEDNRRRGASASLRHFALSCLPGQEDKTKEDPPRRNRRAFSNCRSQPRRAARRPSAAPPSVAPPPGLAPRPLGAAQRSAG